MPLYWPADNRKIRGAAVRHELGNWYIKQKEADPKTRPETTRTGRLGLLYFWRLGHSPLPLALIVSVTKNDYCCNKLSSHPRRSR